MINTKKIKKSLENTIITNLIFDPSILFICESYLANNEQIEPIIENLIDFMNIVNDYNLKLYWNHDLQQLFYQKFNNLIVNYRPQILTSFYQKLFPNLLLIKTEGYNQHEHKKNSMALWCKHNTTSLENVMLSYVIDFSIITITSWFERSAFPTNLSFAAFWYIIYI